MKTLVFLIITLTSSLAIADDSSEAMKKGGEAFSKTDTGRGIIKNLESSIVEIIPVEKDTAAVIGSVAITAAQGKVDTKSIKNMDIKIYNGSMRPDMEYDFKEDNPSITVKYNLSF